MKFFRLRPVSNITCKGLILIVKAFVTLLLRPIGTANQNRKRYIAQQI